MHPCHSSHHCEGVRGIACLVVYLSRQCIIYCIMYTLCNKYICEVHVKRSVILTDLLTSQYFASVKSKRTGFASGACAFESAGLLISFE